MSKVVSLVSRLSGQHPDIVDEFAHAKGMATMPDESSRLIAQTAFVHILNHAPQITPYVAAVLQTIILHDPSIDVRSYARTTGRDLQALCGAEILNPNVTPEPSLEHLNSSLAELPLPRRSHATTPYGLVRPSPAQ
ncbi:MAG: hypothetical protein WBK91_07455 [Alphaproteobacteria bacterium]